MKKRILSTLLALCLLLSLLPGTALAAQTAPAAYTEAAGTIRAQTQTPATWRFLFVIFRKNNITYRDSSGKTQKETNSMTSAEVQAIRYAANNFKSYMTENAGSLIKPVVDIIEVTKPITTLSPTAVSGAENKDDSLWLNWSDCLPLIQAKKNVSNYDHVFTVANLNTIKTPIYWGLTGSGFPQGTGYSFINTQDKDYCLRTFSSSQAFPSSVFVHEFLHFAHNWSAARTGTAPTVTDHEATKYGYDNSNHSVFYADLINKRVMDNSGNPAGIDPIAWANPPVSVRKGATAYTVRFWDSDREMSLGSITATNGKTYGTLPTPVRTGYTFKGWYSDSSYNIQVKATDKVSLTGDQWLYARWEPKAGSKNYTVTFDRTGGTIPIVAETKHVTYGQTYGKLPDVKREGYTFNGWYTAKTGGKKVTADTKVTTSKDHTLYARWTEQPSITVTFNPNGGEIPSGSPEMKVTKGAAYGNLQTPVREDYTFAGWYTAKSGGKKITADTIVTATKNQTLYARWSKGRTFQVTFDPNGGTVIQDRMFVTYSGTYRTMPTPVRKGYHFAGWYTAKTGGIRITPQTKVEITAKQTLYAHWTTAPVTVKSQQSGSWNVTIPAGYKLYLYDDATSANATGSTQAWPWTYTRRCNTKVELSNGTTRYCYVSTSSSGRSWWFTYSMEMDVN